RPRFTEERAAALQFFVRKHLPELVPVLDELKKGNPKRYEQEVGTLFQATEFLAALRDDPRRHDLELKIWQTEQRANLVLAKIALASAADRKALDAQLQDVTKTLVELDAQVLKLRVEQLTKELDEVNAQVAQNQQNAEQLAQERFQALLARVKKSGN
ncbi:MAG: hypothetical protein JNM56_26220, partial [Planctomycetia bacterium]|nr:hypothetical protein [Planctomycetia bacterium]